MAVDVAAGLMERARELDALQSAVAATDAGRGCVVLVTGEPGIGKTSLVRAFLGRLGRNVRVLRGTCDDLLAPRALGPLHEAARGTGGPLERALGGPTDAVFGAVVAQLGAAATVLVVEDVHWADDATLDVLRYLARRVDDLPAVLVLTLRDDAVVGGHPVQQLLGALAGTSALRLRLEPLSPSAVAALSRVAGRDGPAVHAATGGNPFFVSEALAAPPDVTPASVSDAVLARLRPLGAACRAALDQLSVVPTLVEFGLADALFGDRLDVLAEAEERGIIQVGEHGVAFRHELARRVVEAALPGLRRRAMHQAVVHALRTAAPLDLERLVHHAAQAADAAALVEHAPPAGRQAATAGSHRQALAHFEAAVPYAERLPPVEQARLLHDYSWELYIAHRFADAVRTEREAVARYEALGDPVALGEALVRLSRHVYMTGEADEAEQVVQRAVAVLAPAGSAPALATASTYHGALLTLTGRMADAVPVLRHARALAVGAARTDMESLCLTYLGLAGSALGAPDAEADLRAGLELALRDGSHEAAARAYVNLGEVLYGTGRWAEHATCVETGLAFARDHGLWQHGFMLELQRHQMLVHRGEWTVADASLRALLGPHREPSSFDVYGAAFYGRLLVRCARQEAAELVEQAWQRAVLRRAPLGLVYAGRARVEWAWLAGEPERAREVAAVLLPGMRSASWTHHRGELLRYLARAGVAVEPLDDAADGPAQAWAAGLRGDWRAAAQAWERVGDPYERALELAESGLVEPTLEALRALDDLGAVAPATLVRRRLRGLGVRRLPRRQAASTRANPAGLTSRELDVLELLGEGATNAEIAARLVLSVRTVDHHVAAILGKLGVRSRREAVAAARDR